MGKRPGKLQGGDGLPTRDERADNTKMAKVEWGDKGKKSCPGFVDREHQSGSARKDGVGERCQSGEKTACSTEVIRCIVLH